MTDATDMSTPVTRGELRAEIDRLERKLEHRFAQMVTKADLAIWGQALLERMTAEIAREIARHTTAFQEEMSRQFSVIDDKYADLPARVSRLEAMMSTRKRR